MPKPVATLSPRPSGSPSRPARGRPGRPARFLLAALLLLAGAASAAAQVGAVGPVGMTVSDLDRSREFYSTVLHFVPESETEVSGPEYERLYGVFGMRARVARLRLGDERIELVEYLAPAGRVVPPDSRANDRWFQHVAIIVSDMDRAYGWLRRHRVRHASTGPQTLPAWNRAAAGIKAFYFRDPDGHFLEVLWFPAGKGQARWQAPAPGGDDLFLGIDHTAIVVADTERSLAFYRDRLGLKVAGESENHGTEQEHLNNVFGARLRITTLRAAAGPGVELLEYLAPAGGRPYPADAQANDLLHWQTTLAARDLASLADGLRADGAGFVSPAVVRLPEPAVGFAAGFLVRDPDGHVMQVVEPAGAPAAAR